MPPTAEVVAARVRALPVVIEDAVCCVGSVALPDYPGGTRPCTELELRGGGQCGRGEHVGFATEAHASFRRLVEGLPRGQRSILDVGAWVADAHPYSRAALEAATIDLALRQHRTNLFRLAGVDPEPVRWVVSFGVVADPVGEAVRHPGRELKIDVDAAWSDRTYRGLAALGRVAVLDFKRTGEPREHERAHRALPAALVEDPLEGTEPWSASLLARVSFDAPISGVGAIDALPVRPAAINIKPARMGGVLAALDGIACCGALGIDCYIGGMWEVGVGRAQLRDLAALACPEGPNDIAPRAGGGSARLLADATRPGFGA